MEQPEETRLTKLSEAKRALTLAKDIVQVKEIRDRAAAAAMYARQQRMALEVQNDGAELRLRAQLKAGEMLDAMEMADGGDAQRTRYQDGTESPQTLTDLGISKRQSSDWQKFAAMEHDAPGALDDYVGRVRAQGERLTDAGVLRYAERLGGASRVTILTGQEAYNTPKVYIELARLVLGGIDLDPASNHYAQTIVQATTFYTAQDDGLTHDWQGTVWLNPPYAYPAVELFVRKAWKSWQAGTVTAAMALVNNATDTGWFQEAAFHASAVCFTRGRINFYTDTIEKTMPTQGQAFLYFGEEAEVFARCFRSEGIIMRKGPDEGK